MLEAIRDLVACRSKARYIRRLWKQHCLESRARQHLHLQGEIRPQQKQDEQEQEEAIAEPTESELRQALRFLVSRLSDDETLELVNAVILSKRDRRSVREGVKTGQECSGLRDWRPCVKVINQDVLVGRANVSVIGFCRLMWGEGCKHSGPSSCGSWVCEVNRRLEYNSSGDFIDSTRSQVDGAASSTKLKLVCCNPHHWTCTNHSIHSNRKRHCLASNDVSHRLSNSDPFPETTYNYSVRDCQSESPVRGVILRKPVEVMKQAMEAEREEDRKEEEELKEVDADRPWCNIVYHEFNQRHGSTVLPVMSTSFNVFQGLMDGEDGMCLSVIQPLTSNRSILRTREKIGHGLRLVRQISSGCVQIINSSTKSTIFVSSRPSPHPVIISGVDNVQKLLPGQSIDITLRKQVGLLCRTELSGSEVKVQSSDGLEMEQDLYDGTPVHLKDSCEGKVRHTDCVTSLETSSEGAKSIVVSFVKGWGPGYRRQWVSSCPCWVEILC